jgi:hypothetical protein
MPTFVLAYRMTDDYTPGRPGVVEAWNSWFEGVGDALVDRGNPVFESTSLGQCGAGTNLGGYSIIRADDLEAAVAIAKGCPSLNEGAGLEVGVITEIYRRA